MNNNYVCKILDYIMNEPADYSNVRGDSDTVPCLLIKNLQ